MMSIFELQVYWSKVDEVAKKFISNTKEKISTQLQSPNFDFKKWLDSYHSGNIKVGQMEYVNREPVFFGTSKGSLSFKDAVYVLENTSCKYKQEDYKDMLPLDAIKKMGEDCYNYDLYKTIKEEYNPIFKQMLEVRIEETKTIRSTMNEKHEAMYYAENLDKKKAIQQAISGLESDLHDCNIEIANLQKILEKELQLA